MKFDKVHHIAIIVSDYEKAKDFYVGKLGFEIVRDNYREEKNDYKLDLKLGDSELEIFCKSDAPKRMSHPEALGLRHLAFYVDDVEKTMKELNALGIETEPLRTDDFTGKKMTFFKDPDGLPIEIHE